MVGGGSITGGATKKKFGKNLNKLTKPPALAAVSGVSSSGGSSGGSGANLSGVSGIGGHGSTFRGSASSRNGLLLLSTKSKSKTSSSGSGGGLLASSSSTTSSSRDTTRPKSVHDSLLSAVAGREDDGVRSMAQMTTAWGVGEKASGSSTPSLLALPTQSSFQLGGDMAKRGDEGKLALVLAPRGGLLTSKRAFTSGTAPETLDVSESASSLLVSERVESLQSEREGSQKKSLVGSKIENGDASNVGGSSVSNDEKMQYEPFNNNPQTKGKSFHSEGLDSNCDGSNQAQEMPKDDQVQYMSMLAKERSEKRRLEEETRMAHQKERAALRLRELEMKKAAAVAAAAAAAAAAASSSENHQTEASASSEMNESPASVETEVTLNPSTGSKPPTKVHTRRDVTGNVGVGHPSSQIKLEPLGKPKKNTANSSKLVSKSNADAAKDTNKNGARALYDPSRTFSSLVGGKTKNTGGNNEEKGIIKIQVSDTDVNHPAPCNKSPMAEPEKEKSGRSDDHPPVQLIQLNRFDDRDRGDRGTGSGPRMLFDPKSGSMVAVPCRDDSALSAKSVKKLKQKVRKDFDFVAIQKSPLSKRSEGDPPNDVAKILSRLPDDGVGNDRSDLKAIRKQKGRKEEPPAQRKDKKRLDNEADAPDNRGRHAGATISLTKQQKKPVHARIPRTCGVLYVKDDNGNYVSADGCEADQGYGAHSVPGGRVKNPFAYAKLLEQQQHLYQKKTDQLNEQSTSGGFSGALTFNDRVRNDPSFRKHQTDFEAQQQRILEEAWSSLLDEETKRKEADAEETQPSESTEHSRNFSGRTATWAPTADLAKSSVGRFHSIETEGDGDEYAAALAISPVRVLACVF